MVPEVTPEAELLLDYKFCPLGLVNICGRQQRCSKAVTAFKSTLLLPMRSHPVFQTGFTLAHMTYLLAKNPDKQETLYEELRRELPPGQPVTHEMLERNLKYLRATLREVNRSVPQVCPQRGQQVSTPGLASERSTGQYLRAVLKEVNRTVPQSCPQRGQQVSTSDLSSERSTGQYLSAVLRGVYRSVTMCASNLQPFRLSLM